MGNDEATNRGPILGQASGVLWALGHPLILTGVYIFQSAVVFQANFGGTYEMPLDHTTYMLAGLIPSGYYRSEVEAYRFHSPKAGGWADQSLPWTRSVGPHST